MFSKVFITNPDEKNQIRTKIAIIFRKRIILRRTCINIQLAYFRFTCMYRELFTGTLYAKFKYISSSMKMNWYHLAKYLLSYVILYAYSERKED